MVTNHVYTIAGAKGGVGKTTSSINLGTLLAAAGYSTVVVEMDLAMANLVDFLDVDVDTDEDATFHDVLAGDAAVTEAMYETDVGLSIVPSGTTLEGYADTDLDRLPGVVETLRWHHDIVLLDTPAGLSEETVRPLELADDVLLVSTPRVASIRNVSNTNELAERVGAPVRGLILTKSGTGASPGADEIAAFLDVELLGHVPEDDAVPHSQDAGTPVVRNAPNSGAAIAYERISEQLVDTEKASTDATTASTPPNSPVTEDTPVPGKTERQAQGPTAEAIGTTDGGREIDPTDIVAADGDETAPSPADEGGPDGSPTADPPESGEAPAASRTGPDAETESMVEGADLVGPRPPDESTENEERAADTPPSETGESARNADTAQRDTATGSATDAAGETDGDPAGDGAGGLGARMRSLFGL
ncbi:P-loop NTPase [Haloarcula brevis]|uniref:P-loop NTPase n=1 Tax=Haloarcula brevis TaxID=3111453 RepID=UPI00300E8896